MMIKQGCTNTERAMLIFCVCQCIARVMVDATILVLMIVR